MQRELSLSTDIVSRNNTGLVKGSQSGVGCGLALVRRTRAVVSISGDQPTSAVLGSELGSVAGTCSELGREGSRGNTNPKNSIEKAEEQKGMGP